MIPPDSEKESMSEYDDARAMSEQLLAVQQQQRAVMEETTIKLQQDLLRDGADPRVLRQYELNVIDLALLDAMTHGPCISGWTGSTSRWNSD